VTSEQLLKGEDAARRRLEEAEGLERACANAPQVIRDVATKDREWAEANLAEWTA
jgi:hypothetical protein